MSSNPWDKFFWNDWENDPGLKLCGLAAQGLWMRILCICAKADPKGYLVVAGRSLSAADLAALAGKPQPEVETLLRELAQYGVSSTDRTGRIYNRRMVRDAKKSRTAVENGKKGGNPTLSKQTVISPSDNPPLKPPDKPHKPEAISQEPERKKEGEVASATPPKQPDLLEIPEFLDRRNSAEASSAAVVLFAPPLNEALRAFDAYNAAAEAAGWATARALDDRRAKALKARLAEIGGFEGWAIGRQSLLGRAVSSKFLRGHNDRGWKPTGLDWFLKPANATKIMEGAYDDPDHHQGGGGRLDRLAEAAARAVAAGGSA